MGGEIYTDSAYYNNKPSDVTASRYNYYASGSSNISYLNSAFSKYRSLSAPKNEYEARYNSIDRWLQQFEQFSKNWAIEYEPVKNRAQNAETKAKAQAPIPEDTQIPIDLGDGKTTTVTYKELNDSISNIEQQAVEGKKELEKIEKNVDDNGNARVKDDTPLSKMSFKQKLGRVGSGLLSGGWKFVKSFFGCEDGKEGFKNGGWKRCLANVATLAGTVALSFIPYAGPYLAAAALWITRGDAICNTIGIENPIPIKYTDGKLKLSKNVWDWIFPVPKKFVDGKGIYGMCQAKTAGELEAASESIGVALVEFAGSKAGSKALRVKGSNVAGGKTINTGKYTASSRIKNFKQCRAEGKAKAMEAKNNGAEYTATDRLKLKVKSVLPKTVEEARAAQNIANGQKRVLAEAQPGQKWEALKQYRKDINKSYCANKEAFEAQKKQMLDDVNGSGNKQNISTRVRNKIKPQQERTYTANEQTVLDNITECKKILNRIREKKINLNERAQIDNALANKRHTIQRLKQYKQNVLAGKNKLGKAIENDAEAKALFTKEIDKLILSEYKFNFQYKQLYRAHQKAIGAQAVREINPEEVAQYTGKTTKSQQLWALNKKPEGMKSYKYFGKFGAKALWDGSMATYNGGKAFVGKPGSMYMIGRYMVNPEAYEGEFISKDQIAKEKQTIKEYENYADQLKAIRWQAERYYYGT